MSDIPSKAEFFGRMSEALEAANKKNTELSTEELIDLSFFFDELAAFLKKTNADVQSVWPVLIVVGEKLEEVYGETNAW